MKPIGFFIVAMSITACFALLVTLGVWELSYEFNCQQYLKRAADANTVELATTNLDTAIKYLEAHELTNGVVSIFFHQPSNDIGFWYSNIRACQEELSKVKPDTSAMEKSNLLMKLRETLLDNGESGTVVTHPSGISAYPYNALMFWLFTLNILLMFIGAFTIAYDYSHDVGTARLASYWK